MASYSKFCTFVKKNSLVIIMVRGGFTIGGFTIGGFTIGGFTTEGVSPSYDSP